LKHYQKRLKKLLDDNLLDIIFFGSFVKGGTPKDIDLALIVKEKKGLDSVKKDLSKIIGGELDIQIIDLDSIYNQIWLTLIKEGFSVKKNKFLYGMYNIKPLILFKYSLKKLNNVQKVQFERGIKKVLEKEGSFLTRSVVLVPLKLKNEFIDFLKTWNIYYESQEYELVPFMRKENFI